MTMPQVKMLEFDPGYLREFLKERGESLQEASLNIGRSRSYLFVALKNGTIARPVAEMLGRVYAGEINMAKLLRKETPKEKRREKDEAGREVGYSLQLLVHPEKVETVLKKDGVERYRAYAWLKGEREMDLLQAVSYSTHMLYKMAEQKEMERDAHG